MNEAVVRHLVFGRDIIFTFGPFASVYTQLYHPSTYPIMLIGSAILAAALCCGFALLSFKRRPLLLVVVPFLVAIAWSRDALFLSIPFLLMLSVYRISLPKDNENSIELTSGTALLIGVVTCAVGILPLIKVSFLGLAFIEGAASIAILLVAKRFQLAATILIIAAASMCIGWMWAEQPIRALPHYLLSQGPIVAGYSEGMSVEGPFSEVIFWVVPAIIFVIGFYVLLARSTRIGGLIATAGFALYLATSFKAGFVRQDMHQHAASAALLFSAIALATMLHPRKAIVAAVIAIVGWALIEHSMQDFRPDALVQRVRDTYYSTYVSLTRRVTGQDSFPQNFAQANEQTRIEHPIRGIVGTTDLYPMQLNLLYVNGLPWSGRPVIQSYSTYRPQLDQINAGHLTGSAAPENILFSIGAIDNRLPSLEDALSWGVFLTDYSIVGKQIGYIQMKRTLPPRTAISTPLLDTDAQTNEAIPVPPNDGITIARIRLRPTLVGQAVLAAYKLPQVYIQITLTTGRTVKYRYIPEMGTTGFVLSPLVTSNDDFVAMAAGQHGASVKEIRLISSSNLLWKKNIHVTMDTLHVQPQSDAQKLFSAAK
ncbi:hypothetical protein [Paraburkholderia tropica]|uniref:hypothetical protein n=1 Tax=Paraburkholderia tropica TaxID=92647 RepID=UPI002AB72062|nr:hypothetical protein [Paraburkholderia tropica]